MKLNKTPGLDFLDSYGLIPLGLKFLDIYGNVVTSATRYYIFKCYSKTQKTSGNQKINLSCLHANLYGYSCNIIYSLNKYSGDLNNELVRYSNG